MHFVRHLACIKKKRTPEMLRAFLLYTDIGCNRAIFMAAKMILRYFRTNIFSEHLERLCLLYILRRDKEKRHVKDAVAYLSGAGGGEDTKIRLLSATLRVLV